MKQWPVMAATAVLILVLSPFQGTDIGKLYTEYFEHPYHV